MQDSRIDHIYKIVETVSKDLAKIQDLLAKLDKDSQKDKYREVEGVVGVFDGLNMITKEGTKIEVPANYAAKSRIVFGDTLKMIDEDGSKVFKQVEKVPRKKVEGILMKKEGKWHILADAGTFRVSDIAADFYQAQINDEASAFIPEGNNNVPFATLDRVKTKEAPNTPEMKTNPLPIEVVKPIIPKPEEKTTVPVNPVLVPRTAAQTTMPKKPLPDARSSRKAPKLSTKPYKPKEFVNQIAKKEENPPIPITTPATSTIRNVDEDDLR